MFYQLKPLNLISIISLLLLVLLSQNGLAAIYKWKDDSGQIHYGNVPPRGVASQKMGVSSFTPPPPPSKPSKTAESSSPNNTGGSTPSASKAENKDPYTQQQHDTLCNNARKDIETLNKGGRVRVKQADGSSNVLSDEERSKRVKTMQDMIKKHCK